MSAEKELQSLGFVNIKQFCPSIILDLRYATKNNFTHKKLYNDPLGFLRLNAAKALAKVQSELAMHELCLVIWDAYRPARVQKHITSECPDPPYQTGKMNHCRGIAVDVTLADQCGNQLSMPTEFDVFSKRGHHGYSRLSKEVILRRDLLRRVMEKNGFVPNLSEWWHYAYEKMKKADVVDVVI